MMAVRAKAAEKPYNRVTKVHRYVYNSKRIDVTTHVNRNGIRIIDSVVVFRKDGKSMKRLEMVNAVSFIDSGAEFVREYPNVSLWESRKGITMVTSKEVRYIRKVGNG